VTLPPDTQTSLAFVEEAKRSQWVTGLFHVAVHQLGMLLHLAQTVPDVHLNVANHKKITTQSAALSTPPTMALGCLTGVNDTQMTKL